MSALTYYLLNWLATCSIIRMLSAADTVCTAKEIQRSTTGWEEYNVTLWQIRLYDYKNTKSHVTCVCHAFLIGLFCEKVNRDLLSRRWELVLSVWQIEEKAKVSAGGSANGMLSFPTRPAYHQSSFDHSSLAGCITWWIRARVECKSNPENSVKLPT